MLASTYSNKCNKTPLCKGVHAYNPNTPMLRQEDHKFDQDNQGQHALQRELKGRVNYIGKTYIKKQNETKKAWSQWQRECV